MSRRKTNRDHAKKKHHPLIENEVIASHLQALLSPAIFNQQALYRQLGLRNRILNLPLDGCGGVNSFMAHKVILSLLPETNFFSKSLWL